MEENLILQSIKGHEQQGIDRAAEVFPELASRMKQIAGSLSGGEQQMLALARAYLANVDIVVVDEASLGLAPLIVDRIFEFLAGVAATGKALLLVEQYVPRALGLADAVCLLDRGRMVFSGPAAGLDPDDFVARYLGEGINREGGASGADSRAHG